MSRPTTSPRAPPASAAGVERLLQQLGLHHAAALLPAWLERAARHEVGYAELLQGLLEEEAAAQAAAELAIAPLAAGVSAANSSPSPPRSSSSTSASARN